MVIAKTTNGATAMTANTMLAMDWMLEPMPIRIGTDAPTIQQATERCLNPCVAHIRAKTKHATVRPRNQTMKAIE